MKTSGDVPESYRRSLAMIDYTSPVCKINVALDKIPNFLADPNTSSDGVMPHHQATIHLNCEDSDMIEQAYNDAKSGIYSRQVTTNKHTNTRNQTNYRALNQNAMLSSFDRKNIYCLMRENILIASKFLTKTLVTSFLDPQSLQHFISFLQNIKLHLPEF